MMSTHSYNLRWDATSDEIGSESEYYNLSDVIEHQRLNLTYNYEGNERQAKTIK